jgi:hypothetical protein
MPSPPELRPIRPKPRSSGLRGEFTALCGAAMLLLIAGPSSASSALSLERQAAEVAGPICLRAPSRPYQNLAGFSLVVGSILILAPRRDPELDSQPGADAEPGVPVGPPTRS